MHLTHFVAMALFALLVSIAFGCLTKRKADGRVRQVVVSFLLFMAIGIGIAWILFPFSR